MNMHVENCHTMRRKATLFYFVVQRGKATYLGYYCIILDLQVEVKELNHLHVTNFQEI
uniref:Uncharacterized protein n=1 Tax=Rhizophora mucronata TaxID=61149 RepID=A0A2P2N0Y7_RHIMU